MRYIDEYRDGQVAKKVAHALARITTQPWTLMEVCGGQTHAIVKFGVDELLPNAISLVHGPGCPVCVTPVATLDQAIAIHNDVPQGLSSVDKLCSAFAAGTVRELLQVDYCLRGWKNLGLFTRKSSEKTGKKLIRTSGRNSDIGFEQNYF